MVTKDNFKIVTKENTIYDMAEDFGSLVRSFKVISLKPEITTEKIEGRNGTVKIEKTFSERRIEIECDVENLNQYEELKNTLYLLDDFFIIRDGEPEKRWLVEVSNEWIPDSIGDYKSFTLSFISFYSFAESINKVELKHTSNFTLHNIGDVDIDMVTQQDTELEFRGVSQGLTIRNNTTGQEWRYNGSTNEDDVICLKGIRSTKNGISIFGQTNRQVFKFVPGWNDIEILNAEDYEITIRTRFYYI